MCVSRGNGRTPIGVLVFILDGVETAGDEQFRIRVITLMKFRVIKAWTVHGCNYVRIWPVDDISIAEEETMEANERAGRNLGYVIPEKKEDISRMPTADLASLGPWLIDVHEKSGNVAWLINHTELPMPKDDPNRFTWWFARVAPASHSEKIRMLATTSVRERLKICWEWMFDLGLCAAGLPTQIDGEIASRIGLRIV